MSLHIQYAKITLLSFNEELPLKEIQGNISSGNLSVNGSSSIRRTINLTMLSSIENSNLEDIDNEISINKKIKILIGLDNPLKEYSQYGDIIWFPCGVFVISSASINRSTNGWTISITGKDKMCLLDGSVGGILPASTTFHESLIALDNGDIEIRYPTIFQIIFEAVNHWGKELAENIIINDIDEQIRQLVRYMGESPIYFTDDYTSFSYTPSQKFSIKKNYGEDVGYKYTDFTYPGELILKAGDSVVTLLDQIVKTLGNYEYFYDLEGHFIFQEIKNYLNTGSPLQELDVSDYVKTYNHEKFTYELSSLNTVTAINKNPKYDNVKNDFYVWGTRKTAEGAEVAIRYHLAIDDKPDLELAKQYMWEIKDKNTGLIVRYDFNNQENYTLDNFIVTLIGSPCEEWREELYRRALNAQVTNSVYDNYYDSELIAEWRKLYNPLNKEWQGWNPVVYNDPSSINFWLDFIDTDSVLGKYSIKNIGRRTKVVEDSNIKVVYNKEVPDIIFVEEPSDEYANYFVLNSTTVNLFQISTSGSSCFDKIRELLYQNLCYNTTISITCLPKYYIEPNTLIFIKDFESNIQGNYQITQYSLPLSYNGTMNITATEVLTRV